MVFHRIYDAKDHGILGQRGLTSDSAISDIMQIGVIRTFIGGERACSIHSEGNLPIGGFQRQA